MQFRLLPDKTLAAAFEKSADGRKESKDRVTLNLCSNASGSIKVKPLLIGKAKKPRCFKFIDLASLPVVYKGQQNAWMDTSLFLDWFHNTFVPFVQQELLKLGLEPRAILTRDNCLAHPDPELLVSKDKMITIQFLPANVTSLIQPMDQGVIQALKLRYRKKLLRKLLIEDDMGVNIVDFVKSIHMLQVSHLVAEAWEEIPQSTFRKSWQKILPTSGLSQTQIVAMASAYSGNDLEVANTLLPLFQEANANDFLLTLKEVNEATRSTYSCSTYSHAYRYGIRFRPRIVQDVKLQSTLSQSNEENISQFKGVFQQVGYEIDDEEVYEWLTCDVDDQGVQMLTDSEICQLVSDSKDDDSDNNESADEAVTVISNSEAAFMFEQCLVWLDQKEKTLFNTAILKQLHALAAEKRMNSFKQTHITSYF